MFPYIAGEDRFQPIAQRVPGVGCLDDIERSVAFCHQPCPARSEEGGGGFGEQFLELLGRTVLLVDLFRQRSGGVGLFCRREAAEVEGMVPYLGSVVIDPAFRFADDRFQVGIFKFRSRDQVVEVIDICLVVFAIVEFQGFPADDRLQRIK